MKTIRSRPLGQFVIAVGLTLGAFAALSAAGVAVKLTGDQEVPAVTTSATAAGTIVIKTDKSVSGVIKTSGISGTMAHIHLGAPGKNGPPIITLVKTADDAWSVPDGAVLTDDQYQSFKDGNLYVNVHSDAHKGGEIRAQLKP